MHYNASLSKSNDIIINPNLNVNSDNKTFYQEDSPLLTPIDESEWQAQRNAEQQAKLKAQLQNGIKRYNTERTELIKEGLWDI